MKIKLDVETSFLIINAILSALLVIGWVWNGVIKWRESRTWHIYGCVIMAISFACLFYDDLLVLSYPVCRLPYIVTKIAWFIEVCQLVSTYSFIFNAYAKDHPNDGVL